jgi:hypothetical protein
MGGPGLELGLAVTVTPEGVAHVVGRTSSPSLPGEDSVGLPSIAGRPSAVAAPAASGRPFADAASEAVDEEAVDAFVATVGRSGKIRWTTRLAGSGSDVGTSIARAADGKIWAMGRTTSSDFPMIDPIQGEFGGDYDVWVARLASTGRLERSTYLGGENSDFGLMLGDAIAVDDRGRITLVGKTDGPDFPVVRPLQRRNRGGYDAWVARIDPEANRIGFSSFLGGSGHEFGVAVALDSRGRAWLVGKTGSADFPARKSLQPALAGRYDVWIARLARNGQRLELSTYLGGSR